MLCVKKYGLLSDDLVRVVCGFLLLFLGVLVIDTAHIDDVMCVRVDGKLCGSPGSRSRTQGPKCADRATALIAARLNPQNMRVCSRVISHHISSVVGPKKHMLKIHTHVPHCTMILVMMRDVRACVCVCWRDHSAASPGMREKRLGARLRWSPLRVGSFGN